MSPRNAHKGFRLQIIYGLIVAVCVAAGVFLVRSMQAAPSTGSNDTAPAIDSLHGICVFKNGPVDHVAGRHLAPNGYNYGLKWQCVEFVKRYYAEHLNHYMPETWGHAKDFYDKSLPDASYNESRALVQYANPSLKKPAVDDILVFDGTFTNRYGHIAIISAVYEDRIEIIQQNAGPNSPTRETIEFEFKEGRWRVLNKRVLGWLRIE